LPVVAFGLLGEQMSGSNQGERVGVDQQGLGLRLVVEQLYGGEFEVVPATEELIELRKVARDGVFPGVS
jgi:hypothetical protein